MNYSTGSNSFVKSKTAKLVNMAIKGMAVTALSMPFTFNAFAEEEKVDKEIELITVTGIRGSLAKATEVKRSLDVVADVISAEDIGKFPDQNLAESLQRISGVQISRNRGEGDDVSIRGLSPSFSRIQFNGRTLPSATGGRSFDFTILPSDFVSALEVYKTPSADMEEGALSGTVNVKTPRPLDLGKSSLITSIKGIYEENSGKTTPDLSVLYTNVNDDNSFGITLGAHYDKRILESHFYEAFGLEPANESGKGLDFDLNGTIDDSRYQFDHATNYALAKEERERTTFLATAQWRPSDKIDIWLEGMYSEFDIVGAKALNSFRWTNVVAGGSVYASQISGDLIESLGVIGVDNRNNARTADSNDTLTSVALGTNYQLNEDWLITAEIAYAKSENVSSALSHEVIGRANAQYDFSNDYAGIPSLTYAAGYDPLDGNSFRSLGFNGALDQPIEDENIDIRIDVDHFIEWNIGNDFSFVSLEFGAKYSSRSKYNGFRNIGVSSQTLAGMLGETYDPNIEGGSFNAASYMSVYSPSSFFDGYDGSATYPTEWLSANVDTLLSHVSLDELIAAGTITEGGASVIDVQEDVFSGYAKLSFSGDEDKLNGNFGIRVVSTDQESSGNIPDFSTVKFDQGGAQTFVDTSESSMTRSYTEVLPSFNLSYDVSDDVVVRFGAARVMSRPDLAVLSPATTIDVNVKTINSSNPNVDPYLADQIDLSFEWYFEEAGMLSVSPFVKFIDSFVVSSTQPEQVTYTDLGGNNSVTDTFTRFLPDNGKGSDMYGYEVNWQQPLDFVIEGLGFSANFTVVHADEIQTAENGPLLTLDGLSETSYNMVAYYENETFGARLAYNYRDKFVNNGTNYFGDGSFTNDYKQLDFSASYNVTENVSVILEALNITNEVQVQTNSLNVNRGLEDVGSRFTLGVRAAF
ncbi:TonB-dependent receptor [Thalassotalea piscium]|uniref:Iron complex outermembrane receptor protein n=1 Tax=Thalassotalea piscium TaxID=1230533 RepID=A0A7X0NG81_9GAMM|nr:TonB-dependent receptor [Thalassotalea piscium]MBB6542889.1 iron complex outermembrane receptor protein [Thalassotalea piscium]